MGEHLRAWLSSILHAHSDSLPLLPRYLRKATNVRRTGSSLKHPSSLGTSRLGLPVTDYQSRRFRRPTVPNNATRRRCYGAQGHKPPADSCHPLVGLHNLVMHLLMVSSPAFPGPLSRLDIFPLACQGLVQQSTRERIRKCQQRIQLAPSSSRPQ